MAKWRVDEWHGNSKEDEGVQLCPTAWELGDRVSCAKQTRGKSWPDIEMSAGAKEYTCDGRTATIAAL